MEIAENVLLTEINKRRYQELANNKEEGNGNSGSDTDSNNTSSTERESPISLEEPTRHTPPTQPGTSTTQYINDLAERTLIRYIIRYGDLDLFPKDDAGAMWKVAPYIFNDLKNDEIVFSNPIYQKIREEAEACFARSETHLARYFTSHPDPEISDIALNCISDKYELSKVHTKYQHIASEEERIGELVPRALFELKDAIIGQEIAAMQQQLKRGEESIEEKRALMQKLSDLFKVKAALAKELGERIVRPR